MNMVLLTFHLLSWSNPSTQADTAECVAGLTPERLDRVELLVSRWPAPGFAETLRVDVRGREGMRDSAMVDDRGTQTVVYAQAVDLSGNRSCWSDPKTLAPIVDVPLVGIVKDELFDLSGRRVKAGAKGIYFRRVLLSDGTVIRKVVVVR